MRRTICPEPSVRKTMELDLALIDPYDKLLRAVELSSTRTAKGHDTQSFARLQSVPGIGQIFLNASLVFGCPCPWSCS